MAAGLVVAGLREKDTRQGLCSDCPFDWTGFVDFGQGPIEWNRGPLQHAPGLSLG